MLTAAGTPAVREGPIGSIDVVGVLSERGTGGEEGWERGGDEAGHAATREADEKHEGGVAEWL